MKITGVEFFKINIPLRKPQRWAGGVNRGWTRCVIRMLSDEGLEGYGECLGSPSTLALLDEFKDAFLGEDPLHLGRILKNFWWVPFYHGLAGKNAVAALETCCWDIVGKSVGRPLSELLGGRVRDEVPIAFSIFQPTEHDLSSAAVVEEARAAVDAGGFGTLKLKGGVLAPDQELEALAALRAAFPEQRLRLDPNGIWAVATAVSGGRLMEELDLEYLEDPVWGVEAMRRVRRDVRIPLATNMCVVGVDELPAAIRATAVDIVLLDPHEWGGLSASRKGAATCEAFRLGLGVHSGGEGGVSTALHLHLAASLPVLPHAIDSFYMHQVDDFLTEPHRVTDGKLRVPTQPGLGVDIDREKLDFLVRQNQEAGDLIFYADRERRRDPPYMGQW